VNGKKAKKLRKMAGYDPNGTRVFINAKRTPKKRRNSQGGAMIMGMHVATGARRRYLDLKKAYRERKIKV